MDNNGRPDLWSVHLNLCVEQPKFKNGDLVTLKGDKKKILYEVIDVFQELFSDPDNRKIGIKNNYKLKGTGRLFSTDDLEPWHNKMTYDGI